MLPPHLHIYTYKQGWLAKLAHDLCICVQHFNIELEATQVRAEIDLGSFSVDGVMERGQLNPNRLSQSDRNTINRTIAEEIFLEGQHQPAIFSGSITELADSNRYLLTGVLQLMRQTHRVEIVVELKATTIEFQTTLVPSQWGIPPYRAMGGALKLQDRVEVRGALGLDRPLSRASWATFCYGWSC